MSPQVRFCRNFVACAGVLGLLVGVWQLIIAPAKWVDCIEAFGMALMCFTIVREVNRREGDWHKEAFVKKPNTPIEPTNPNVT